MRVALLCALFALPVSAADFTLETEVGEASRDASSMKSTYVVKNGSVTLTIVHEGPRLPPGGETEPLTGKLSNTKDLDAALAAIRKTSDDKKPPTLMNTRYRTGCLIEAKKKFCSTVVPADATSARLDAIAKLEQVILKELAK